MTQGIIRSWCNGGGVGGRLFFGRHVWIPCRKRIKIHGRRRRVIRKRGNENEAPLLLCGSHCKHTPKTAKVFFEVIGINLILTRKLGTRIYLKSTGTDSVRGRADQWPNSIRNQICFVLFISRFWVSPGIYKYLWLKGNFFVEWHPQHLSFFTW